MANGLVNDGNVNVFINGVWFANISQEKITDSHFWIF